MLTIKAVKTTMVTIFPIPGHNMNLLNVKYQKTLRPFNVNCSIPVLILILSYEWLGKFGTLSVQELKY